MTTIDTSTWTDEQRAEFAALDASIAEETAKAELGEAKREAERLSPVNVLAERKAALEAKAKVAALATAELVADVAFRKAIVEHGGKERVARIFTEEGSIILRAMTLAESDDYGARVEELPSIVEKIATAREALAATVVYPSRDAFNAAVTKWPGLWAFLYVARDAMIAGIKEDTAGKGSR
jgi:hypothetical protein